MKVKTQYLDGLFEIFWMSGMRKMKKKKAKKIFMIRIENNDYPEQFTQMLVNDVHRRLSTNQLGFKEMHPTTYLNNERWDDEIREDSNLPVETMKSTVERMTDRSWAE